MARYRGTLTGRGRTRSLLGDEKNGMTVNLNGMVFGLRAVLYVKDKEDTLQLILTTGSFGPKKVYVNLGEYNLKKLISLYRKEVKKRGCANKV